MDNITHAFVGAAMAECAVPRAASPRTRTALMCVGVVAANAPDVDLLYTSLLAEEPLAYLLHHRGHSHTLPGLAALGMLIWSSLRLLPRMGTALREAESRWVLLIAAGLLSHLAMDSANGYGTHPFYPLSSRWFYGDAVFVLEPWLWAILGAALALNAGRFWRVAIALLTIVPIGALVFLGVLRGGVPMVLLGVVGAATIAARPFDRRRRAAAALLATTVIFLSMAGISRVAKSEARDALAALGGTEIVDIVADANPGVPWCWSVLTLHRATGQPTESLTANRATLSLLPGMWPATACASAQLSARWSTDVPASDAVVWHRRWQIDVAELRALYAGNCRVRAWLQFGRVPYVTNGHILDLRFESPVGQNFTPMAIDGGTRPCPSDLTDWEPPRLDVLTPRPPPG
jgi:inner membrane protein